MSSVLERMPVEQMEVADGGEAFDEVLSHDNIRKEADARFYHRRCQAWEQKYDRQDIMTALAKMGVRPFTPESVQKYKNQVQSRVNWKNVPARAVMVAAMAGCIGGAIGSFILCISAGIVALLGSSIPTFMAWAMIGLPASLLIGIAFAALTDHIEVIKGRWQHYVIDYVDAEKLPEFVLQTALDLDSYCPGCHLYVEEYEERNEVLDPFLYVHIPLTSDRSSERIYLEVWNEVGFEKEYEPNWLSFS